MKQFKVIVNGPRQSNPNSVFYLTNAKTKGFWCNQGELCIDYADIDCAIGESDKFQDIIIECGIPSFAILDYTPLDIYEMTFKNDHSSIDDCFDEYVNNQELNELLQPIFRTYEKMMKTFIRELIEDTRKTSVLVEEEDGCYISLEIKSEHDEISKEILEYCIDRTKARCSEKFKRPLVYNFMENGIEFFRAEIDFNNIAIEITEIGGEI